MVKPFVADSDWTAEAYSSGLLCDLAGHSLCISWTRPWHDGQRGFDDFGAVYRTQRFLPSIFSDPQSVRQARARDS